jgi:hypothetical protein
MGAKASKRNASGAPATSRLDLSLWVPDKRCALSGMTLKGVKAGILQDAG